MKKTFTLLFCISIILISCTKTKKTSNPTPRPHMDNKTIKQNIAITDSFYQITNISSAMIDFNIGPLCVIAEGDSSTLSHLSYEFDGGILTISTPIDRNNDYKTYPILSDAVVHVSCPNLKAVAICSGGGFRSKGLLKTESIQFGGLVGGSIDVDSIECDMFRYDGSGSTTSNFKYVKCNDCTVCSTGSSSISLCVNSKNASYFDISGSTTIKSTISSPIIKSIIETQGSVSYDIETETLSLRALKGTINLCGHATTPEINVSPNVILSNNLE